MSTAKKILALTLMLVVFAAVPASAQGVTDAKALAGKWKGWGTGPGGSSFPVEVQVDANGSYTSLMDAKTGRGTFKVDGGKVTAQGHLSGPDPSATASQLTLTTKGGKQMLSGSGRDDRGPYTYQLTKE